MSDYMFMLENHLSADQNQVLAEVQAAAGQANLNIFLAGGAMRDVLGGFHVRDLDFSVEGNAVKLARTLAESKRAVVVSTDEHRRSVELQFSSGVRAQIAMSRQERYSKTGARPQVTPATIQEDLRGRDFSINAIALSLNKASLGLLLDPTNGLADLERRELRTLSPYTFYDDPSRMLRLVRLRVRLGFTVEARTATQYQNARAGQLETYIPPRLLFEELRHIAEEANPTEVLRALEQEGLLGIFSPALAGGKLNLQSLGRLEKAVRILPEGNGTRSSVFGPFFFALTEKLSAKEKSELIKKIEMSKAEVAIWQKLDARARKVEQALKSARIKKPSQVYQILSKAETDEVLYLLYHSGNKPVQERIRNYLQKYLPMAQEMPPAELEGIRARPGTPKYDREREAALAEYLNRRPKKQAAVPAPDVQ